MYPLILRAEIKRVLSLTFWVVIHTPIECKQDGSLKKFEKTYSMLQEECSIILFLLYLYVLSLSGLNVNDTQNFARVLVLLKQLFLADKKLLTKIISISWSLHLLGSLFVPWCYQGKRRFDEWEITANNCLVIVKTHGSI